jgi:hypothetical protein
VNQYFEIDGRIVYNPLPNASVFVGWREMKAEIEEDTGASPNVELDDGFYGGIRLRLW